MMPRRRRDQRQQRDRGAATIYAAAVGLALLLAGSAVAMRGAELVTAANARTAADVAALAGAMRAGEGAAASCSAAGAIAARNGATVVSCLLTGLELLLTVQIGSATATARAGPV